MSRKLDFVPKLNSYKDVLDEMDNDFNYRMDSRLEETFLGRPLYERINLQIVMTQECPYKCPFCLERKHPMKGHNDFEAQLKSLKKVLLAHPNARLTLTGGEPSLYINHVKDIYNTYKQLSNNVFMSINTTLYDKDILSVGEGDIIFNISVNDYVKPDLSLFNDKCCYQTILDNEHMTVSNIKKIMDEHIDINNYSFRFLTELGKSDYSIDIFNDIQNDEDFKVKTFRIGDFFVYLTFEYKGNRGRITLGDMNVQMNRDYKYGYSNIIIHPDGHISTNWK